MNFEFSDEQNMLREQAQGFLRDKCPLEVVRRVLNDDALAFDRDVWNAMIGFGWPAVTIPEQYGGIGLGYLELCVIAEELGRSLAPTPFASSVYLATEAILQFGSEAQKSHWLPKLAAGEVIGTLALAEGAKQPTARNLATTVSGSTVSGTKLPVPDGDIADLIIVVARDGDGTSMVLVDANASGITRDPVKTIDPTRSHAQVNFANAACEVLGTRGAGFAQVDRLFNRAAVPFAFEQIGGAHAALDMGRAYAMGRYAFGRPIASFQAIKHKLADMYIAATLARSNGYYGAWALSTDAAELPLAAATARVSATEAFHECSKENIQTHGGMGFTWEFNCHLYYRRSKLLAVNLGSLMRWKDRLVTELEQSNATAA